MSRALRFTIDSVAAAFYGPWCIECQRRRTRNPSRICFDCLGERRCPKCRGTGITRQIEGCGVCSGTGMVG
jgi:hypothetical protein